LNGVHWSFLDLNGATLTCNDVEFEGVVLAAARGELDHAGVV